MTEAHKIAAEYARYSMGQQNPRSIDDQLVRIHPAAIVGGYEVPSDYILTDSEISRSDEDRPGYRRVMELARSKKISAIFVEDQSRLWRSQREMHRAIALLKFWGVKVFCVSAGTEITSGSGSRPAPLLMSPREFNRRWRGEPVHLLRSASALRANWQRCRPSPRTSSRP